MKIEPKHTFTYKDNPRKETKALGLATVFKEKASFNQKAQPLTNRVQLQKSSKAEQRLTKTVQSITGRIPTPFIKR